MAESEHVTGSANLNYGSKEDRTKNTKQKSVRGDFSKKIPDKKKMLIVLIEVIFCIIFMCILEVIYQYAVQNHCSSDYWDYISDYGIQILGGGLVDIVVSLIAAYIMEKKICGIVFWQIFLAIMAVILLSVCLFTYSKIKGAIAQQLEKEIEIIKFEDDEQEENAVYSERGSQSTQKLVVEYKVNQDLYMSNRPLEDYYVGEISSENEKIVKAEILFNNLEHNMPTGSKSVNYTKLLETADKEYDTYMYQRKRDKGSQSENDALFSDRMEMLQKSLDKREEAHKECEDPENERPLANGYKDMGDEYFSRGLQNDAIIAYEKSAEWYIKVIYHAAAKRDYDEMKICMDLFEKLGKEVEKLNEIGMDRKEKIINMVEVYKVFVNKINE